MIAWLFSMTHDGGSPRHGHWVERARELFAGAFARTWPVEGALPVDERREAETARPAMMGKK